MVPENVTRMVDVSNYEAASAQSLANGPTKNRSVASDLAAD
jgi:hypothetical protein